MKTSVQELIGLIGTHCFVEPHPGLRIRCRITNVKTAYGRQRLEIEAIEGEGRTWVNAESVSAAYADGTHRVPSTGRPETAVPGLDPSHREGR